MIFYFSGTGNSLDAAMQLQGEEKRIDIAECMRKGDYHFSIEEGENVGFVFPVYFGGLPSIVQVFLSRISFDTAPKYLYAVLTCGGSMFGAGNMAAKALAKRGLELHAAFSVVMPDNYIFLFEPESEEAQSTKLQLAQKKLSAIRKCVEQRKHNDVSSTLLNRTVSAAMYPLYVRGRKTEKFYTDDQCIGCATCVKRCPANAMIMEGGRPKWIKEKCIHCMSCIRCGAVQYGTKTVDKKRYKNPVLNKCH